jgi:hypothetical protein
MDILAPLVRRRLGERGPAPLSEPGARNDAMLASSSMLSVRVVARANGVGSGRAPGVDSSVKDSPTRSLAIHKRKNSSTHPTYDCYSLLGSGSQNGASLPIEDLHCSGHLPRLRLRRCPRQSPRHSQG